MAQEHEFQKDVLTDPTESEHSPAISSSEDILDNYGSPVKQLKLDSDSLVDLWDQPKPATPHKLHRPSTQPVYKRPAGLFSTNFTSPPRGSQNSRDLAVASFQEQSEGQNPSAIFLAKMQGLQETFMISDSFVRENRPLLNYHETQRQEACRAICFHYMRICGLNHIVLP